MNPLPTIIPPQPAPTEASFVALARSARYAAGGDTAALHKILADLLNDESALYAITREWRYDTAGRQFVRLHALLDEQFSEIGLRLTRLAARSRIIGGKGSTSPGAVARPTAPVPAGDALQPHMMRELLGLHGALIAGLKRDAAVADEQFRDHKTAALLTDLAAEHEKDAFLLRALLWEVEHTP